MQTLPADFLCGMRTRIMAIVNVTDDSFSGDGLLAAGRDPVEAAVAQGRRAEAEGADLLDVGGMSTRPGAPEVPEAVECARVEPVIAALARETTLPISVDTFRAAVADAALAAGATIVNSVWGLRTPEGGQNDALASVAARRNATLVLTHNRRAIPATASFGGYYPAAEYHDVRDAVLADLQAQADFAQQAGIARERLWIDPGLGFGKTPEQNLIILRFLGELTALDLPILIGASRKSFLGKALGDVPPEERDIATAAVTAIAVQCGATIARVHNVAVNVAAARIADAVRRGHF